MAANLVKNSLTDMSINYNFAIGHSFVVKFAAQLHVIPGAAFGPQFLGYCREWLF